MFLWIIAGVLLVSACIVGYYQGAVRGAFSLVGLLLAAALAMPCSVAFRPLLRVCGVEHPVLIGLFAPVASYLVILILLKVAGLVVHRKLDTYYRYLDSDTRRLLYARLNERLGICLGVANATVYFLLLCLVFYVLGYFTIQVGTSEKDSIFMRVLNVLARDVETTGMAKAIAPLNPAPPAYYEASDILGVIFQTPLLQRRLNTYPPFLLLSDRPEFKEIGKDNAFQEAWARGPAIAEFTRHERIQPLVKSIDMYEELMKLAGSDLPDLKTYLYTGTSPKYDSEKILGRWEFDNQASLSRARRLKPTMGTVELRTLRKRLAATMANAVLTATVDNRVLLKVPAGTIDGRWKSTATGKYIISGPPGQLEASIEADRIYFTLDKVHVVFRRT